MITEATVAVAFITAAASALVVASRSPAIRSIYNPIVSEKSDMAYTEQQFLGADWKHDEFPALKNDMILRAAKGEPSRCAIADFR